MTTAEQLEAYMLAHDLTEADIRVDVTGRYFLTADGRVYIHKIIKELNETIRDTKVGRQEGQPKVS